MTPHAALHERMNRLARDLQSMTSSATALDHVVDLAVRSVGPCDSASISLARKHGTITTSAASEAMPTRGDELQMQLGEGPCTDAVWQEPVVSSTDLVSDERWPRWAPRAVKELGVRSMLCVRLFTHEDIVGALNLYATQPQAFTPADVEEAVAIAAHAAVAVVAAEQIEHLEHALCGRTTIGQATGVIMGRYNVTSSTAFHLLVKISNDENRKISVIAAEIVEQHDIDPSCDLRLTRRRRAGPKSKA